MLRIEGLTARYGELLALDSLSMHVEKQEVVAIIGANGAGKSTLLSAVSGLLAQCSGNIVLEGRQVGRLPPHAIVDLGITHVPEGRRLFPFMTVQENLEMGAFSSKARAGRRKKLEEVFELLPKLRERSGQLAHTLSGGEQQMCAIGRGLMSSPQLLMLDEPTLGLAPLASLEVFRLVKSIRESGTTVIIVEQQVAKTLQVADRGYVLESGRVTMHGTGAELLADKELRRAYLGL